ncbi:exopolyphosphatase / guanosine-5'-triphosphate,3'-diphosphate pyrophosphatase [Novosphingobium sp. CF614]|uniref:Ppx/GppA phosphatase family protein n=1 Tax=Novosphingobium sp. CF614 TaxID=1884364 RepID=UPI0008F4249C|nr:exopolyphosphatase [Novosphingobium sp. CF614]SFF87684.1 exopolyphosphatase / guanosine-5'-triphosphate,3'-diphosphate pyrophosphatase [Novosphingobium sp. CF614]
MIGISLSSEKRAIIDIGSNTVRLVVYNGPPRAPVVILNEKVSARLGKDLGRTGAISDKAMRTALSALARFAALLRLLGVDNVECVATAAARDAANGAEFLDAVRGFGLAPRLLSGEEEARASAAGVIAAFPGARGIAADLGGGSLELVEIDGEACAGGITLPFGTLRLPDMRAAGPQKFAASVRAGLKARGWGKGRDLPLYIVGGSWRALALQAMRVLQWPVDDPHGFQLPASEALHLARLFAKGRIDDPDPRISSARLATLPDAAALLTQLIASLRPSRLVFSSWGLREGLLHMQLPKDIQRESPMLASVAAFALNARVSLDDASGVAAWTAPACRDAARDGDLRKAASLLALAAMRTEPNMRTEEALTWALRKRWIGLDMRGRGMMAMTVFANSGLTAIPPEFTRLADKADLDRAIGWGLAVRLCRRLTGGTQAGLASTALSLENGRLVLSLKESARPLYNGGISKDLKALAEWLGLEWSVEATGGVLIEA